MSEEGGSGGGNFEELIVAIRAEFGQLVGGMQGAIGHVEKFGEGIKHAIGHGLREFEELGKKALEIGAIFLGVGNIISVEFIKKSLEAADHIGKLSEELGVSSEALAGYKLQAQHTGQSLDDVASSLRKMQKFLDAARDSSSAAGAQMRHMGLDAETLIKMNPEQAYAKIADGIAGLGDRAERTTASMEIFGRGGLRSVKMLEGGSAAIAKYKKEAEELGISLSEVDTQKVLIASEKLEEVKATVEGIGQKIAVRLTPFINEAADWFLEMAKRTHGFQDTIDTAMKWGVQAIGWLLDAWLGVKVGFEKGKELAIGFVQTTVEWLKHLYTGFSEMGQIITNFAVAIGKTAQLIGQTFLSGFMIAGNGVKLFVSDALSGFANMLGEISKGMVAAGIKGASEVVAAAATVQNAAGVMSANAQQSVQRTKNAFVNTAKEAGDAWRNLLTVAPPDTPFFDQIIADSEDMKAEIEANIDEMLSHGQPSENLKRKVDEIIQKYNELAQAKIRAESEEGHGDGKKDAHRAQMQARLDEFNGELNLERLGENRRYEQQKQEAEEAFKELHTDKQQQDEIMLQLEQEHQGRLLAIKRTSAEKEREWDKQTAVQKLSYAGSTLQSLMTLTNGHNRKAFELSKKLALGEAIVSTAAGVAQTFDQLGWYALFGPAEAVAAAGAVQIAQIQATSFDGGGSVGSVPGGGSAPNTSGDGTGGNTGTNGPQTQPTAISVRIDNDGIFSPQAMRNFIDNLNQMRRDGVVIGEISYSS